LCLRRIREADGAIRAWVEVSPRRAAAGGLLSGVPFGVKDIFETRGMATEYGSPLYAGRKGERDAAVVEELSHAGAVLLGKTQTSAFASFAAAPTRNPRLAGHTPGASSAGSAAAVAARMVPFAVGSQTLGSVLRPASYCGVCGFKPSHGLVSTEGMLGFAPSLDTVGLFTETAGDMAMLWSRGFSGRLDWELRQPLYLRVAADETMTRALQDAVEKLRAAGIAVTAADAPPGWDELLAAAARLAALVRRAAHAFHAPPSGFVFLLVHRQAAGGGAVLGTPGHPDGGGDGGCAGGIREHRRPGQQCRVERAGAARDRDSARRRGRAGGHANCGRVGPRRRGGIGGRARRAVVARLTSISHRHRRHGGANTRVCRVKTVVQTQR